MEGPHGGELEAQVSIGLSFCRWVEALGSSLGIQGRLVQHPPHKQPSLILCVHASGRLLLSKTLTLIKKIAHFSCACSTILSHLAFWKHRFFFFFFFAWCVFNDLALWIVGLTFLAGCAHRISMMLVWRGKELTFPSGSASWPSGACATSRKVGAALGRS